MSKLEETITVVHELDNGKYSQGVSSLFSPLALLLVTLAFIGIVLSVPVGRLSMLLWFCIWPLIAAPLTGTDFSVIFRRSLIALPFVLFIGVFNPIIDRTIAFSVAGINISRGWISFLSIIIRGMLSVQALLVLIHAHGFSSICRSLELMRLPSFISTQLMMVYRYMTVMLEEALDMSRARKARGYGKKHYSFKMWTVFIGQLFIRTIERAQNIHNAMLARGFTGKMPHVGDHPRWKMSDTAFVVICVSSFALLRFVDLSSIFFSHYFRL